MAYITTNHAITYTNYASFGKNSHLWYSRNIKIYKNRGIKYSRNMALDFSRNLKLAKASENKMFSTVFSSIYY